MKLLSQRAAIHSERPGRYGSFEIIACLAGANSLITALAILVPRLPYDAPVTQTRGSAARIEARTHVPRETPSFMYAGVRG